MLSDPGPGLPAAAEGSAIEILSCWEVVQSSCWVALLVGAAWEWAWATLDQTLDRLHQAYYAELVAQMTTTR